MSKTQMAAHRIGFSDSPASPTKALVCRFFEQFLMIRQAAASRAVCVYHRRPAHRTLMRGRRAAYQISA